jgi:tryptophan 2,3-dioxygenase
MAKPLTYASYLRVDELLELQTPLSDGPEHDEMLFIVIHQVYELWFKQVLHETDRLVMALTDGQSTVALATLERVLTILKTLVAQVDVLETMTPVSFASFRSRLEAASGFQSAQFRELEMVLGRKNRRFVDHYPEGTPGRDRIERRYGSRSVWSAFVAFLASRGYAVPAEVLDRDWELPTEADQAIQDLLVEIYHHDPGTTQLCERLVDLDEGLQEWRYRHVKMVERTIGTKPGTGGSAGVAYLKSTLFIPLFPDLWEIRARL